MAILSLQHFPGVVRKKRIEKRVDLIKKIVNIIERGKEREFIT
jgi:hypothetical protein